MGIFDKLFGKKSKKVMPEKRPSELTSEAYTNKELGFSITPPKGWNIHEPDFGIVTFLRGSVVFYAPMGKEIKEVGDLDVLLSEGVPHIKIIVMETEMTLGEVDEKSGVSIIQLANRKIESNSKNIRDWNITLPGTTGCTLKFHNILGILIE